MAPHSPKGSWFSSIGTTQPSVSAHFQLLGCFWGDVRWQNEAWVKVTPHKKQRTKASPSDLLPGIKDGIQVLEIYYGSSSCWSLADVGSAGSPLASLQPLPQWSPSLRIVFHAAAECQKRKAGLEEACKWGSLKLQSQLASIRRKSRKEGFYGSQVNKDFRQSETHEWC